VNYFAEKYVADKSRDLLVAFFMMVSCLASSSTLKIEEIFSSDMSVDFHHTMRYYIKEDRFLHNHRCENLKSNKMNSVTPRQHVKFYYNNDLDNNVEERNCYLFLCPNETHKCIL
jgi:hypothetical protein